MIKIENLTKIYKSKKKNNTKALDNINLTLQDNGLVFVIGKSGSGKSTLLNLIGGLDNISDGKIIVDGNDLSTFNESKFSNYRNNHIGFIFQDYHLLDELTVFENIALSLQLNKIEDLSLVKKALKKVDLEGYENRYPSELSGGERQRVAIARAIVKKPKIILADEPTGNLDNVTATAIIKLLKDLSEECLIIIVSHNTNDTYKYADRIIILSKGQIISDESRNPLYNDYLTYKDDSVYYPMDKLLDEEDINTLNQKFNNKEINKIVGVKDKYLETKDVKNIEENIEITNKNLSLKNSFKLCMTFLKNKLFKISTASIMISVIMIILSLAQTIINFDSGKTIQKELNNNNMETLLIKNSEDNQYYGQTKFNAFIDEETIDKFVNTEYSGDIIPLINHCVPVRESSNFAGKVYNYFTNSPYLNSTLGTLIIDEQFFNEKIGKLEYVVLNNNLDDRGVYITDYLADSILLHNTIYLGKTYTDILGKYTYGNFTTNRAYINGIIKTNYKEKYKDFLDEILANKKITTNDIIENPKFINLYNEIYSYLGYSYTFNKNFIEDNTKESIMDIAYSYQVVINDSLRTDDTVGIYVTYGSQYSYNLIGNEVYMPIERYNKYFNTKYNESNYKSFKPHSINIKQYTFFDEELTNPLLEEELYIKGLHTGTTIFYVSEELFDKFNKNTYKYHGIYFNGHDGIDKVINLAIELDYEIQSQIMESIKTMSKAVEVFIPIFELIAIVLCLGVIFILINFSTKMIKDKLHEIGILKALGCKSKTIGIIFGLQITLIAILTIIISTIGYVLFIDLANDVLITSLKELAKTYILLDLNFLTFKVEVALVDALIIVLLAFLSFVVPILQIHKIKPVQIIKNKE